MNENLPSLPPLPVPKKSVPVTLPSALNKPPLPQPVTPLLPPKQDFPVPPATSSLPPAMPRREQIEEPDTPFRTPVVQQQEIYTPDLPPLQENNTRKDRFIQKEFDSSNLFNDSQVIQRPRYEEETVSNDTGRTDNDELYKSLYGEYPDGNELTSFEEDFLSKLRVASSETTDENTLTSLSRDPNWEIRQIVALNPRATLNIQKELQQDQNLLVRAALLQNPNLSIEVFNDFIKDKEGVIVALWIEDNKTTEHMLYSLHDTDDFAIALAIVETGKAPDNIILHLSKKHVIDV